MESVMNSAIFLSLSFFYMQSQRPFCIVLSFSGISFCFDPWSVQPAVTWNVT